MTKIELKKLVRKWNILPILLMAVMGVGLASCGDDKEDDVITPEPVILNQVTITNNSGMAFRPIYIVYLNAQQEPLSTENLGDLLPNASKTAKFPTGTAYYYLAFMNNGTTYFTANHTVNETSFTITAATSWM